MTDQNYEPLEEEDKLSKGSTEKNLLYCLWWIWYIFEKNPAISIICGNWSNEDKKIFKEEELTEIIEFLDLNDNREEYQNK